MIYLFRPLPLMKACRWMTCHLTVHTIIIPMSKKTRERERGGGGGGGVFELGHWFVDGEVSGNMDVVSRINMRRVPTF